MALCVRVLLMLLLGIVACRLVVAAPAPAPAVDCLTVLGVMTDCVPFVTGGATAPPTACCKELATVVKGTPQCLCQLYNTTFTSLVGINVTLAMELPTDCKVKTPDPSLCSSYGIPVAGPVGSTSPAMAPSPASKTPASTPKSSTPKASSPSKTPKSASPPNALTANPSGTPTTAQPNVSSTTTPSSPNNAHETGAGNVGAVMLLLLIACMFFS